MKYNSLKLWISIISFVAILLSASVTSVAAQAPVNADANGNTNPWVLVGVVGGATFQWTVSLNPVPAAVAPALGAGALAALAGWFPAPWAFAGGLVLPGAFNVVRYDAIIGLPWTAGDFEVDYVPGGGFALPANTVLQWIQYVTTNRPSPAGPGAVGTAAGVPYLDAYAYDYDRGPPFDTRPGAVAGSNYNLSDGTPFYWTDRGAPPAVGNKVGAPPGERAANSGLPGGVAIRFTDKPWRFLVQAAVGDPVTWVADLYLCEYNTVTNAVTIDSANGIRWGFTITRVALAVAPPAGPQRDRGGAGGDKYDGGWGTPIYATIETTYGVGGNVVPVDKLALLAPYIGLASTTIIGAVATVIYVKRVKHRKEKQ